MLGQRGTLVRHELPGMLGFIRAPPLGALVAHTSTTWRHADGLGRTDPIIPFRGNV